MSDLDVAFINDEFASGFMANLESDIDGVDRSTSVKATVSNSVCDEDFVMTTYAVDKASASSENGVPECVWEACYVLGPADSNVTKTKWCEDRCQERELKSGHSQRPQNNMMQKNGGKNMSKRKAKKKRKRSQRLSSKEANPDNSNDACSLVELRDASGQSVASSVSIIECVEIAADHMTDRSGSACTQEMVGASCNGDDVNALPVSVSQEDLVELPYKNICAENSDENKNVLNYDVILEKDCQEKVVLQSDSTVASCQDFNDVAPSSSGHIVECMMDSCPESTVTESMPSIVEENVLTRRQQKKVTLKTSKRRRSLRLNPGMIIDLERQVENQICSESDDLSSIEREQCAGTTTVLGRVRTTFTS